MRPCFGSVGHNIRIPLLHSFKMSKSPGLQILYETRRRKTHVPTAVEKLEESILQMTAERIAACDINVSNAVLQEENNYDL